MRGSRQDEIEIKLRVADARGLVRRLRDLGARRIGRVHERNVLFDTAEQTLGRAGKLVRLRWNDDEAVLTFKSPAPGRGMARRRYKVRREIEFALDAPKNMARVFEGLGLHASFRYEKFRTTFRLPREKGLKVELDVTPIGCFLELEGAPRAIDRVARLLGYARKDYITTNYLTLYREHCRRHDRKPGDMLFRRM
ncbi:MAG: class IV adenylate cyclase [Candidatus Acidiferrales bacterium]